MGRASMLETQSHFSGESTSAEQTGRKAEADSDLLGSIWRMFDAPNDGLDEALEEAPSKLNAFCSHCMER